MNVQFVHTVCNAAARAPRGIYKQTNKNLRCGNRKGLRWSLSLSHVHSRIAVLLEGFGVILSRAWLMTLASVCFSALSLCRWVDCNSVWLDLLVALPCHWRHNSGEV